MYIFARSSDHVCEEIVETLWIPNKVQYGWEEIKKISQNIDQNFYKEILHKYWEEIWVSKIAWIWNDINKYENLEYHVFKEVESLLFRMWKKVSTQQYSEIKMNNFSEFNNEITSRSVFNQEDFFNSTHVANIVAQKFWLVPWLWLEPMILGAINRTDSRRILRFIQFVISSPQYNQILPSVMTQEQKEQLEKFNSKVEASYKKEWIDTDNISLFIDYLSKFTYRKKKAHDIQVDSLYNELTLWDKLNWCWWINEILEIILCLLLSMYTSQERYVSSNFDDWIWSTDLFWLDYETMNVWTVDATRGDQIDRKKRRLKRKSRRNLLTDREFTQAVLWGVEISKEKLKPVVLKFDSEYIYEIIWKIEEVLTSTMSFNEEMVDNILFKYNKHKLREFTE